MSIYLRQQNTQRKYLIGNGIHWKYFIIMIQNCKYKFHIKRRFNQFTIRLFQVVYIFYDENFHLVLTNQVKLDAGVKEKKNYWKNKVKYERKCKILISCDAVVVQ